MYIHTYIYYIYIYIYHILVECCDVESIHTQHHKRMHGVGETEATTLKAGIGTGTHVARRGTGTGTGTGSRLATESAVLTRRGCVRV